MERWAQESKDIAPLYIFNALTPFRCIPRAKWPEGREPMVPAVQSRSDVGNVIHEVGTPTQNRLRYRTWASGKLSTAVDLKMRGRTARIWGSSLLSNIFWQILGTGM